MTISNKTIQLTIYFAQCDKCENIGPEALYEADALESATRKGWILIEHYGVEYFLCPSKSHKEFITQCNRDKGVQDLFHYIGKWSKENKDKSSSAE